MDAQPNTADNPDLASRYTLEAGCFDEMWTVDGTLRPQWQYLRDALSNLGHEELERRREEGQRLLRDKGVTYNVYGDPAGTQRIWTLDPIPLLVGSDEWAGIEAGLMQRAELLNLILKDLYGPRDLIRKGLIPPELVYGHPGFLRACDQIRLPGEHQLPFYAADLARGTDGTIWVLGDRTQAPSGAGYALENRMAMRNILPSLFRDSQVHRLSLFFQSLRKTLADIAPHRVDDPNIVVLTPGPRNETYFEHAYLAAYLGYSLVQGSDLTVRNDRVWLKSLDGLQPVDVILRRVDDDYCDPVELREDSQLGVPGLLQAARKGNVSIVNPLGSGVLENSALMAFLPGISKYLLGQDLLMPSAATWWCGHPRERQYVLENIDKLVIKSIYRHSASQPIFGDRLSTQERETLKARIQARPHVFMGQEPIHMATAPSLADGQLEPRHAVLRSFMVAGPGGYTVMPGGLTRIGPERGATVVSNQSGGISKDTWVLASEPEKQVTLWQQDRQVASTSSRHSLPSRVLDNLYWVGRYAERAEATARLLRTIVHKQSDSVELRDGGDNGCLHVLLRSLTSMTASYPGFIGEGALERLENPREELIDLAYNGRRPGALAMTLQSLNQAAYTVRDLWSIDTWRVLDQIQMSWVTPPGATPAAFELLASRLDRLIIALAAFRGLTVESMTREQGWMFLEIGRRLERGLMTGEQLRSVLVPPSDLNLDESLLESLLITNESLTTYQRRYGGYLNRRQVLELLLLDDSNPRSVLYQLDRLQQRIDTLPREKKVGHLSDEQRLALETANQLRLGDRTPMQQDPAQFNAPLDQRLNRLADLLRQTSDALSRSYFSPSEEPQQLYPTHVDPTA